MQEIIYSVIPDPPPLPLIKFCAFFEGWFATRAMSSPI